MNCPHCGKVIESKSNGNGGNAGARAHKADMARCERAIEVLARCPYTELTEACHAEMARLLAYLDDPVRLWAVYRRGDRKTPYAYGLAERTN